MQGVYQVITSYAVYFINSEGHRDGTEIIEASSKEEAVSIYRRFFNVSCECIAVPRWAH